MQLSGGTGKAHVYLRLGDQPTLDDFDVDLEGPNTGLVLSSEDFLPGIWNVLLHAQSPLSKVGISVECL